MQPVALFVFVPFCKIHCTYCDFNVYANLSRAMEPYADAVVKEVVSKGAMHAWSLQARSIYLGGGTPSLLATTAIEIIMQALRDSFEIQSAAEITLESNPGTMVSGKLRELRSLGINRCSIGVQAFDDATLKRLNRGHTVADAIQMYDDTRRAGFDNINLDFIYGLPLQTLGDWRSTLERALALEPEHLSLYALKVEGGTGLEHQIRRGKYPMPDDDLAAEMYSVSEELLDKAGYEHYEISNWARRMNPGKLKLEVAEAVSNHQLPTSSNLQSKHNLTYWLNQPYLGFGAGAHSSFNGQRYWNILSPLDYIMRVGRGESVVDGSETIDRATEMAETMILGLRLSRGIIFDEFGERYGEDARKMYTAQLNELEKLNLVEMERPEGSSKPSRSVRLTRRGRLLSNEVFWRFLP